MRQVAGFLISLVSSSFFCTPAFAAEDKKGSSVEWFTPCYDGKTLRFSSGFEDGSQVRTVDNGEDTNLQKEDAKSICRSDDGAKATRSDRPGSVTLQFEGGTETERRARVVAAPDNPNNHVLEFWLQKPYVPGTKNFPVKGRVQLNVYGIQGIRQMNLGMRMYLHPSVNLIRSYPGAIDWLTISEWWNNASWKSGEKYPFRISVNLVKESASADAPLLFKAHAQSYEVARKKWSGEVWSAVNRDFVVPVGQWVSLEYGFVEGNAETGRFFLAATSPGGKRTIIFDQKGFTHHPADPNPDGLSEVNPMKLYTSSRFIDHVQLRGGAMQILWDDFRLTGCRHKDVSRNNPCIFQ